VGTDSTFFETASPRSRALVDAFLILGASMFIALCAQIAVRVPFSPVPITGQTLAVLVVGGFLGSRRGTLSVLAYLAEGIAGFPVFAGGGSGPIWLLGPTGGYLVGFVAAAWVAGCLCERLWDHSVAGTLVIMLAGSATIYLIGLPWLGHFVGTDNALALGLVPFVAGDLLKVFLAALALHRGRELVGQLIGLRG
jgi:biotin transport system substrate-specific component